MSLWQLDALPSHIRIDEQTLHRFIQCVFVDHEKSCFLKLSKLCNLKHLLLRCFSYSCVTRIKIILFCQITCSHVIWAFKKTFFVTVFHVFVEKSETMYVGSPFYNFRFHSRREVVKHRCKPRWVWYCDDLALWGFTALLSRSRDLVCHIDHLKSETCSIPWWLYFAFLLQCRCHWCYYVRLLLS